MERGPLASSLLLALALGAGAGVFAGEGPPAVQRGTAELEVGPAHGPDERVGPAPGAVTIGLAAAVRLALERNLSLLDTGASLSAARWHESAARGQFLPKATPLYLRFDERAVFGLDLQQRLPWSGGTLTASGRLATDPTLDAPFPRTSDVRLLLQQPLLRGFGPNTTFFELTNARRARVGRERGLELARQRLAVEVAAAFYGVIAQRQLLEVARQSLERTEGLRRSSAARLEAGLASKLDVYRSELQSAQAEDAMVRAEAGLASALEGFRALLALQPDEPLEPEAVALPDALPTAGEPVEALVRGALERRLEVVEARDQVDDGQRAAALTRQNLLPQLDVNLGVVQLGFGSSFGNALREGDTRVELFLSASYPIEQSSQKATRAVAELDVETRERGVRQRELEVDQEVRAAARELERIRKSVELQRQAVSVAEQQRRLAVLRYQRGLGSNFDVVDAEGSLVIARSALVGLLASHAVARLELKRATGALDVETEFAP